ncbi:hypothetical protein B0J13DRAFT_563381 [Dactylonectria estremocensis]|uniref:Uncharacterized protein n=1 Tax=Dactylonectria estremocensis TaxID=1079267 RepID=A0A9P9E356_9HYPO|nr:hypothetical protein B0J13DRAFT_563381 [Dactylonectria estremocensis]
MPTPDQQLATRIPINSSTGPPTQYDKTRFFQEIRESFVSAMKLSNEEEKRSELDSIISFIILFIKDGSTQPPSESVQQKLDLIWHMVIEMAKALDKDDPFQEHLITLIIWTKELDSLHRALHMTEPTAAAWESYGFVNSLHASWEQLLSTGDLSQQCSLASFSAKALALGIYGDSVGPTALWCLREALETDDQAKTAALLPVTVAWISHCRHKLLTFSATKRLCEEQSKAQLQTPALLARKSGINEPGFSMERWLFWRRRLQELSHSSDSEVAEEAKKGFIIMINTGRELSFDAPGEVRFSERLQAAMFEELKRTGKDSVDSDDINIDVDWVD